MALASDEILQGAAKALDALPRLIDVAAPVASLLSPEAATALRLAQEAMPALHELLALLSLPDLESAKKAAAERTVLAWRRAIIDP